MLSQQVPQSSHAEFQRIVVDMAALLGSLVRWAEVNEHERCTIERAIRRSRARIVEAMDSLPDLAAFVLSEEVTRFRAQVPDAFVEMLREDWLPEALSAQVRAAYRTIS